MDIEKIIKIFENANISKLELEIDNMKIKLEKNNNKENTIENVNEVINDIVGTKVLSPVVGTFYSKKSPNKPPLVEVGKVVKKGDVLCIIEAMKVMNEITAPVDGEILEIKVENESLVEFDQLLFVIGEL